MNKGLMAVRILLAGLILAPGVLSPLSGPGAGGQQEPAGVEASGDGRHQTLPPLPGPASQVLSQGGPAAGKSALPGAPPTEEQGASTPVWGLSPRAASLMAAAGPPDPFAMFETPTIHTPGIEARAVGVGDFNNDAIDDLVVTAGWPADKLLLYTQSPTGTLPSVPVTHTTGMAPDSLSIGDLNGDGLEDAVVANRLGDSIGVFLQDPGGQLEAEVQYPTGAEPDALAVDDLNSDGLDDVVVTHAGEAAIGVFLQEISGTLAAPVFYPAPLSAWNDVATGDFNQDGRLDVAKLNGEFGANPTLSIYAQNPAGSLDLSTPLELGDVIGNGLAATDLTGDGWDDLVLSHGGNRPFARLTQISTTISATLGITETYPAYDVPETLVPVDINLDGREDILALHGGWSSLSVFLQDSGGSLLPYRRYDLPVPGGPHYGPRALAVGDLNSDGLPDAAVADSVQGLVLLYHRKGSVLWFFPFASLPTLLTETPVYDDFSDPNSGWPNIISVYADFIYLDGEYHITNHRDYVAAFATAGHLLEDLDVSVDGRRHGPALGGYGIAFGFTETIPVTEYYALIVWPDYQEWNLIRFEFEDGFEALFWGASSSILTGESTNRMRVRRLGDELAVWVNGIPLFGANYPTFSGSRLIGLLQTPLEIDHDARFDDYELHTP